MIVRLKRLQTCFLSSAQLFYSATGHFVIVIPACLSAGLWEGGLCSSERVPCIFIAASDIIATGSPSPPGVRLLGNGCWPMSKADKSRRGCHQLFASMHERKGFFGDMFQKYFCDVLVKFQIIPLHKRMLALKPVCNFSQLLVGGWNESDWMKDF